MRTEPPVSVPSPSAATRAPSAAPVPEDEPPALRRGSYGLRTPISGPGPEAGFQPEMPSASSCIWVLPMTMAPAARNRATTAASAPGTNPRSAGVPAVDGNPATWMLSLTTIGTPASGAQRRRLRRASRPRRRTSASTRRAAASAPASSSVTKALSGAAARARASASATSASLLTRPAQTLRASRAAGCAGSTPALAGVTCADSRAAPSSAASRPAPPDTPGAAGPGTTGWPSC